VILLSARASGESKLAGLETGADDYLYKPFNAKELRARVKNLIELRRALRRRFARELLAPPAEPDVPSAEEAFLARAREVVEQHLSEVTFNVDGLADALGMSTRQLQRKLRALTGHSPNAFIRLVRLQRSARLLEQGAGTVSEIAYEVGFNHPTYFMKRFREVFGQSPSEYGAARR
jgi:AraC-like DNA-binding protein